MLVNVAVAAAFLVPPKKRGPLLVAALASAAVLQAGRLIEAPPAIADHAALLVQQNLPVAVDWTTDYFQRTLHELTDLTQKSSSVNPSAASPGKTLAANIDLIVWPESPAPFYTSDPLFREAVSDMARQSHIWVITGSIGT